MEGWIVTWSLSLYKAHVYIEGRTENLFLWGLQVPLEKMPCQSYSECCGNRKVPESTVVVSSVVQCKAFKPVREPVTWGGASDLYGLEHKWKSLFCARLKFRPEFSTLFQFSVGRGPKIETAEFLMLGDTANVTNRGTSRPGTDLWLTVWKMLSEWMSLRARSNWGFLPVMVANSVFCFRHLRSHWLGELGGCHREKHFHKMSHFPQPQWQL